MKNELQNLTEDISRLYEEITQKTESLGQIDSITRLYDELQSQLQAISSEEVELLQSQIKSTLEQMVGISKSLAVIKTLKVALNGHDDISDHTKRAPTGTNVRRSLEDR
jgi:chromosome segregation ATPase